MRQTAECTLLAAKKGSRMPDVIELVRPREGVALVTMTNPEIRNHGSAAAIGELASALREARVGGSRVTVLASGVPGHWFEHAWLTDVANMVDGQPMSGDPTGWFHTLRELAHPEVVSIAAVSGDCTGGGAELGWACDLRIAEEQATFGQPEVMIGLATGIGGTSRLMRLIGRTATAEMVFDGAPMTAQRIYELGGLNRVVPTGEAINASLAWASRLADRPAKSLEMLKRMLDGSEQLPLKDALANEQKLFQEVARTPEALERMREIQARFDAGETIRDIYGNPRK